MILLLAIFEGWSGPYWLGWVLSAILLVGAAILMLAVDEEMDEYTDEEDAEEDGSEDE